MHGPRGVRGSGGTCIIRQSQEWREGRGGTQEAQKNTRSTISLCLLCSFPASADADASGWKRRQPCFDLATGFAERRHQKADRFRFGAAPQAPLIGECLAQQQKRNHGVDQRLPRRFSESV